MRTTYQRGYLIIISNNILLIFKRFLEDDMRVIIVKLIRLLALAFIPALIISACGPGDSDDGSGTGGTGPCGDPISSFSVIEITNDITTPTTWTYGNVYVINKYDFYIESTLTIEPGVIIKFHPINGPYMMLDSFSGRIIANGNSCRPVIFTSYKDDAHGGDTNGDSAATSPARGNWFYVATNSADNSVFNYCEFYYGGGGSYLSVLEIYDSSATITNSIFAHNCGGHSGSFYYGALDANNALADTVITGNTFYDNILPLSINRILNIDDSNTFHSGAVSNTYNGIFLHWGENFISNVTWAETEVAFVIDDGDLWINSGASLTLANNVVLKFTPNSILSLQNGASALVNHGGTDVYFSSFKDDAHKGDTNGDGYSVGAPSDWGGIYDDTALGPNYYFTWSNILYDSY
jgi:hypothetical protein